MMTKFKNIEINEETCGTALAQASKNRAKVIDADFSEKLTADTEIACVSKEKLPATLEIGKKLAVIVNDRAAKLQAALVFLNKRNITLDGYHMQFATVQEYAEKLLDVELKLASVLNGLSTAQGVKPINQGDRKTKAAQIKEMGLTERQARDISHLKEEFVNKAKEIARAEHIIPTRALALSLATESIHKNNTLPYIKKGEYSDVYIKSPDLTKPIYYTQLFGNVGIGEFYAKSVGCECKVMNEIDKIRSDWYREIYPDVEIVNANFQEQSTKDRLLELHKKNNCKLICASVPCQDFSLAGKRDFKTKRAHLIFDTLDFIEAAGDNNENVMIENVPGFLSAYPKHLHHVLKGRNLGQYIQERLEAMGYIVNIGVLNGADYGTAQSRERAIILASKHGKWLFPPADERKIMLWEAIGNLPSLEAGMSSPVHPWHIAPSLPAAQADVMKHTPTGCSAHDNKNCWKPVNVDGTPSKSTMKFSFCRKKWDEPCNTILQASDGIGGHCTIHPGRPLADGTWSDARALTVLELLRVTGLPDDYPIPEWASDKLARDVIGECFLPELVKRLLLMIPRP